MHGLLVCRCAEGSWGRCNEGFLPAVVRVQKKKRWRCSLPPWTRAAGPGGPNSLMGGFTGASPCRYSDATVYPLVTDGLHDRCASEYHYLVSSFSGQV